MKNRVGKRASRRSTKGKKKRKRGNSLVPLPSLFRSVGRLRDFDVIATRNREYHHTSSKMFETISHFRTAGLLDDDSMLSSGLHTQIILGITIAPTCYFNLNSFFYYFDEAIRCAPLKTLRKTNTCVTISKKKKR